MVMWPPMQPMETAPKDETTVILFFQDGGITSAQSAFWSEEYQNWYDWEGAGHPFTFVYGQPIGWWRMPDAGVQTCESPPVPEGTGGKM
jgi:hypothetical protein